MSRKGETGGKAPPGRPRNARLDDAILDAALHLFAQGGLDAVTFDGVARRAEVSRSAVYRRWRSREDLMVSALLHHRSRGEQGVEEWAVATSVTDVMDMFAERAARALIDPLSLGLLAHVQALGHQNPVKRAYWTAIVEPRRRAFGAMIAAARANGELANGPDPDLLQDLLAGGLTYRALNHPEPLDVLQARRFVIDILAALGLPRPS